ncbi:MAG: histidine kinase, partial [Frankiaceae bacterium]|nr:histidine kinase [Frankiaceae bacterium]
AAVSEHALAALREALSNSARHAGAHSVEVRVAVRDDELLLEVVDDGIGIGDTTRRSGLGNLAARAAQLGGTLQIESAPGTGTRVTWRVPLAPA